MNAIVIPFPPPARKPAAPVVVWYRPSVDHPPRKREFRLLRQAKLAYVLMAGDRIGFDTEEHAA